MEVYIVEEEYGCLVEEVYIYFDEKSAQKKFIEVVNREWNTSFTYFGDAYDYMNTREVGKNDCVVNYDMYYTMDEPKSI